MDPLETRLESLEERLTRIEKIVLREDFSSKKRGGVEKIVIDNIDKISTQHLVVIALYLKPKQTKQEIKNMLQDWGKAVGNWFQGGNLNNRLLKKGVIKKDDVNEKKEDLFSLTGKGQNIVKNLIEKVKMMK